MSDNTLITDPLVDDGDSNESVLDIARMERRLQEQLERSEGQLLELEKVLTDGDTIQEDRDNTRLVVDSIREDVRQIRRALGRIENGTFGQCVTCGSTIPPERVETIPFVTYCARCA